MPIVVNYQPAYGLAGDAALAGAGGIAAENMRRWDAEFGLNEDRLEEQQRQFDLDYQYRLQSAALQDALSRRQLAQQADLAYGDQALDAQRIGAGVYGAELQAAQNQAALENRAGMNAAGNQRMLSAKQMEVAQRMQALNFEQAMAAEKAVREKWNQYTPSQQEQIRRQHEERFGMPFGAADMMLQQEQQQQQEAQRDQWRQALTAPDGRMIAPEAFVDVLMQLDPKDAASVAGKLWAEDRQRDALDIKKQDQVRDDDFAAQQAQIEQQRAIQQQQITAAKNQQDALWKAAKARQDAQIKQWQALHAAWLTQWELGENSGEAPKWEDHVEDIDAHLQTIMQQSAGDGLPTIDTQAEYDTLPSGKEYIDAQTGKRARKP